MMHFAFETLSLLFFFSPSHTSQFCDTSENKIDPNYMCNSANFSSLSHPPIQNDSHTNNCDVVFLLDLDSTLTTEEDYSKLLRFINSATATCMARGVGHAVFAGPIFDDTVETMCCSAAQCKTSFGFMNYKTYVGRYETLDPVQPVTSRFNFSTALLNSMKRVGNPSSACLYNNYVLITNRLFNVSTESGMTDEIERIMDIGCITFTVIAVGNPGISTQLIYDVYNTITLNTFVLDNFNCLNSLQNCIKPCGTRSSQECYNTALEACDSMTTVKTEP